MDKQEQWSQVETCQNPSRLGCLLGHWMVQSMEMLDINVGFCPGQTFYHSGQTDRSVGSWEVFWRCNLLLDNRENNYWFWSLCRKHNVSKSWSNMWVTKGASNCHATLNDPTCTSLQCICFSWSAYIILSNHCEHLHAVAYSIYVADRYREEQDWGFGAACSASCARQVRFSCWISLLPAEAVLVKKSLNWVTAVLHTVASWHISLWVRTIERPGEKMSMLVKLPPLQVRWEEREAKAINH